MRFRPANISLINRRLYLPRLRLTLSSSEKHDQRTLTGHYISIYGLPVIRPELRNIPGLRVFIPRSVNPAFTSPTFNPNSLAEISIMGPCGGGPCRQNPDANLGRLSRIACPMFTVCEDPFPE